MNLASSSTPASLQRCSCCQALATDTEHFTGAELEGICREAALAALREDLAGASSVAMRHFEAARAAARPSLSVEDLHTFSNWRRQ